jgi:hypothetical protein
MADDFDSLRPGQKIEWLRDSLSEFTDVLRDQAGILKAHTDTIFSLSARYNVLRGAFTVVLARLAKQSGDPERYVTEIERLLQLMGDALAKKEPGPMIDEYRATVKEMFETIREAAGLGKAGLSTKH